MRPARAKTPITFDMHPVRVDQTSCMLAVEGDLDRATIRQLRQAVDDQLTRGRRFTQLDLARLTFCDTAGSAPRSRADWVWTSGRGPQRHWLQSEVMEAG